MRAHAALAGLLALALGVVADEARQTTAAPGAQGKPTLPSGTPTQQVKALLHQYDEAAVFRKRFQAAVSEEEQEKVFERYFPNPDDYATLLVQIAEEHPTDPVAVDALVWVTRHARHLRSKDAPFARASKILLRDHLNSPRIGPFCMALRHDSTEPAWADVLRQVWRKNPDRSARAQAGFALAKLLRSRAKMPDLLQKLPPEGRAAWEKAIGKDGVAALLKIDAAAERKEAEEVLDKLTQDRDYAGAQVDYGDKKLTVGELAGRELFEIRRLQPGQQAPEIEGEDIDGKRFKLSDYRGKVVLLAFSGHWCGPCRGMYPYERSLVKTMQGRPFVILGVNSDADRETFKKVQVKEKLTWRCFWDGGSTDGPIARQWNVSGWPTFYLLDHRGAIVKQGVGPNPKGDDVIEQKVKQAEAAQKK